MEAPEIHPGRWFVLADGDPSPELIGANDDNNRGNDGDSGRGKEDGGDGCCDGLRGNSDAAAELSVGGRPLIGTIVVNGGRDAQSPGSWREIGTTTARRTNRRTRRNPSQFCNYRKIFNKTDTVERKTKTKKATNVVIIKRKTAAERLSSNHSRSKKSTNTARARATTNMAKRIHDGVALSISRDDGGGHDGTPAGRAARPTRMGKYDDNNVGE